mmetsp:Transcript_54073/g.63183  ORF Transcript_54073/g.63183 Transcript_54073/m.63183 type:complete len:553 (+) Transcript_54073:1491-3149(+)
MLGSISVSGSSLASSQVDERSDHYFDVSAVNSKMCEDIGSSSENGLKYQQKRLDLLDASFIDDGGDEASSVISSSTFGTGMSSVNNLLAACNNNTNSTNDEKYEANAVISNYSDDKYFRNKNMALIKLDLAQLIENEDWDAIAALAMDKKTIPALEDISSVSSTASKQNMKKDGSKSLDSAVDWHPDGKTLSISGGNELLTSPGPSGKGLDFTFDKVFTPTATQEIVFDEVSDFVQSALDGYKVCLFSYGQTGSGKTFTMQGKGKEDFRGIIPRAVELVLQRLKVLQNSNWEFTINASFLEIYNEELRDLLTILAPPSKAGGKRRLSMGKKSAPKLAIKKSENGRTYVEGLTEILIDSHNTTKGLKQLDKVITAAARARSVAFNKLNSESSRSHSIFMLDLHGINHDLDEEVQGVLNLCDLAGSERLSRSGYGANDSQRVKETQAINKSLSSLGDVFTSLSNGSPHVPYRNSKLTYLLQDCLNGNGKSLMLMNLCPTVESAHESACSLRFARRVNQVELGKAVKQVNTSSSYCGGSVSGGRSIGGRSVGSRR